MKSCGVILGACCAVTVCAVATGEVQAAGIESAMRVAKPGSVKPEGWLLDRARAARDGFTGHMDEVDQHFRLAWTTNCMRRGKQLYWDDAHNGSWSAEGGAYWFDGLVKLAFQLDDPNLKAMAKRRLDTVLDNVGTNTVAFLWWFDRNCARDVSEAFSFQGQWRFWTAGMSERALAAWWDATGDARVPRTLARVFGYGEMARRLGGMPTILSGTADAWRVTRSPEVARCLEVCCSNIATSALMTPPWKGYEASLNLRRYHLGKLGLNEEGRYGPHRHGVITSEKLLSVFRAYLHTGDPKFLNAVNSWYAFFDTYCRQPYGVTMMDEEWGWAGAKRGTETCDVAAETFTRENILAALGDGKWGDDVERAFFNAGPACVSRDFKRHVYFQMPNRTGAQGEASAMSCPWDSHLRYGRSAWPLCCTAALNRILPNYIQHMWLKTADGGVAAALYGPSSFATDLPVGRVAFEEQTRYPFDETVEIVAKEVPAAAFSLRLRVPGWCKEPVLTVNGEALSPAAEKGFVTIRRGWKAGDRVRLVLPMKPRFEDFRDMNDYGAWRRSVVLGPLLFAQAIPTADDNTPLGTVREAELSAATKPEAVAVSRGEMPPVWTWPEASPLKLSTVDAAGAPLELVPYGCTKLRIAAFALVK